MSYFNHVAATQSGVWSVRLTDGTDTADILDLTNSNPLTVAIVDGAGSQITSFGGGTQYTEGDADASITGTALLWEDGGNTLATVSAATPLPVEIVSGSSSGTEYTQGDTDASITGIAILVEGAADTLVPVQGTVADGVLVNLGSNNDVVVSATDLDIRNLTNTDVVTAELSAVDNAVLDAIAASLAVLDNAVAGNELQVDVLTMPTVTVTATNLDIRDLTAASDNIAIHGDVGIVDQFDLANSNPLAVALVDASGNHVVVASGVQHTYSGPDSPVPSQLTGNLIMAQSNDTGQVVPAIAYGSESRIGVHAKGNVYLTDESDDALGVTDVGSGNVLSVAIVDSNGDQITSLGGGGYTEDEVPDADPTGSISMLIRADTPGSVTDSDGDSVAQRGTNYGAAYVQVVSSTGSFIDTFGGGSQYTEGDTDASITGTAIMIEAAGNTLVPAPGSTADGLLVNLGSNNDVTVTGTVTVQDGGNVISVDDAGSSLTIDNSTLAVVGGGAEATALRVTIASDSTGVLSVDDNGSTISIDDGGGSITVDGTVSVSNSTNVAKLEDDPSAHQDAGIPILVTRKATPANVSGSDGDYEFLQMSAGRLWTSAVIDTALPAGTNNIGDVDIASITAGDNTIGRVKLTDGTDVADILDLANSNPLSVAIVDASGDQITSFGGGTQYTEDAAAAANPVGTAPMLVRADTPGTVTTTDGDNVAQRGTNYGAAYVQIVSSAGAFVDSFGGGTQYTEGDTDATITGTALMLEGAGNALVAAPGTASDGMLVNLGANNDVTVTGTVTVTQGTAANLNVTEASAAAILTAVQLMDNTVVVDNAGFTDTATSLDMAGFIFDEVAGTALTENDAAAARVDSKRAQVMVIEDGTTRGARVGVVDETGTNAVDALAVGGGTPHDSVDSGNPIKVGFKAATAFPTAVASADRANGTSDVFGRQLVTHIDAGMANWKQVEATTSQTGTAIWTPGAGKKIAVTSVLITTGGTTAGVVTIWFGASGDTTFSQGTDQVVFRGEFAPSTTSRPGVVLTPAVPFYAATADHILRYTTSANVTIYITVYGYEF